MVNMISNYQEFKKYLELNEAFETYYLALVFSLFAITCFCYIFASVDGQVWRLQYIG